MSTLILAIDDSPTLRLFIQRTLANQTEDYQVILAKNGQEGLDLAKSRTPDLILLDYILPDLRGYDVCEKLFADPATSSIPVVMMSSIMQEMKTTADAFENVMQSIAKPFTPDLLLSTIRFVLRELRVKKREQEMPQTAEKLEQQFSGRTGQLSLLNLLLTLEQDHATGKLSLQIGPNSMRIYLQQGSVVLVTTKNSAGYLRDVPMPEDAEMQRAVEMAMHEQSQSGIPVYLQLHRQQKLGLEEAVELTEQQGKIYFSDAWSHNQIRYEFTPLNSLPEFTSSMASFPGPMVDWVMQTLRLVGQDVLSAMAWGEDTGIPAFTRRGYERIQHIPLTDDELSFVQQVDSVRSLYEIADILHIPADSAQNILYRFLILEIFDYWPAAILRGVGQTS